MDVSASAFVMGQQWEGRAKRFEHMLKSHAQNGGGFPKDEDWDIVKLEAELAVARKDVQRTFEELQAAMAQNAKLISDLA